MNMSVQRREAVVRAAASIGIVTVTSRGVGVVRVVVITAVLGTTYLGNTFQATGSVSNVFFELLAAGALSAVIVPTFVELLDAGDRVEAERLAGTLWGIALIALGAVALAGIFAAPWIARLLVAGSDDPVIAGEQRELSVFLLRWVMPQVPLYALGAITTAVLHAQRRFVAAAASPVGNTIVVVAALGIFKALGGAPSDGLDLDFGQKLALGICGTAGVVGSVGILMFALRSTGFRLRPRLDLRSPGLTRLLRRSSWGIGQHAGTGILLGASIIVGNGVEGGVVAYQLALMFFLVPHAVLGGAIHTPMLPELVSDAAGGDFDSFSRSLWWSTRRMAMLLVPVAVGMAVLANPAMSLLEFGATDAVGTHLIAAALIGLAPGLFPYGVFLLLARGYYALDESRMPAVVAVVTATIGAVAMVVAGANLSGRSQVLSMGIGHSAAYALGAACLAVGLKRRLAHRLACVT